MGATQQALLAYGAAPFVGALDALTAQGATYLFGGSVRRLLSSWDGDSMRLQGNGTGTPIAAIPFTSAGDLDLTAAAAAAAAGGGTSAAGETLYDQTGRLDATQTTTANQMPFSTVVEAKGGFGDGNSVTARWLKLNLGTLSFPIFVSAVVTTISSTAKFLLGTSASSSNRYLRTNVGAMQQNWGTSLVGTGSEVSDAKHVLGFLADGSSSKQYLDGSLILTGDAGTTQTDMSGGRIGSAASGTTNWLATAGNSISEMIIFASDPTGLAGWPAFVAAQKAYYGIA